MIQIIASNEVKEDSIESFLAVVKELAEKTNALDEGCIRYELCRDLEHPQHFVIMEEWEDQRSLESHTRSPHFTELAPKLGSLTVKPTVITTLTKVF